MLIVAQCSGIPRQEEAVGRYCLASTDHNDVRLWSVDADAGGVPVPGSKAVLEDHAKKVTAVEWSPDAHTLATGARDNTIVLYFFSYGLHHADHHRRSIHRAASMHGGKMRHLASRRSMPSRRSMVCRKASAGARRRRASRASKASVMMQMAARKARSMSIMSRLSSVLGARGGGEAGPGWMNRSKHQYYSIVPRDPPPSTDFRPGRPRRRGGP